MDIIAQVRKEIILQSTPDMKKSTLRFYKRPIKLHGLSCPKIRTISKKYFKEIKHLSKREILDLCERLMQCGFQEEKIVAIDWARELDIEKKDFSFFERWLKQYINDWGLCDGFAPYILEKFLHFPETKRKMFQWTTSKNLYVRRAAAVSHLHDAGGSKPSKHDIQDRFKIAKALLYDEEDLVQKAYGWLLKNASKTHPKEVYDFVMQHKAKMPRTALRYAIEYYSVDDKKRLMSKK